MPPLPSPQPSEWVSFEHQDGETWMFELAFFRSNWQCIYGQGCAGIEATPDPSGHRGCCSYGAHFADPADLERVMGVAAVLPVDVWQLHGHRPKGAPGDDAFVDALTTLDADGERITRVVDGACIFLNRPDFDAGPGCALHVAAERAGLEPLEWKPEVCWQLPIRVEHHVDDNGHATHMVRQWIRRDWGDAGHDLGWWCAEAEEAYSGRESVARYVRAEIVALAGDVIADALIEHVERTPSVVGLSIRRGRAAPTPADG